ncbi:hypothetical protein JQC92_06385 [Shewanella sp. 202IG2-18]|nr:hypothetical protein [Parashewanella hymeniacidonis]MBM7071668.1 hypothetical protein [Parashewanella hymeniacidonis]
MSEFIQSNKGQAINDLQLWGLKAIGLTHRKGLAIYFLLTVKTMATVF